MSLLLDFVAEVVAHGHVGVLVPVDHLGALRALAAAGRTGHEQYFSIEVGVSLQTVIHLN